MWSNRDPNLNVWNHLETLFVSARVEVASMSIDTVIYIWPGSISNDSTTICVSVM